MTSSEIRQILNSNIGRTVEVKWAGHQQQVVKVVTVDNEGFVYDLVPPDPKTPFWTNFEEVIEITPSKFS